MIEIALQSLLTAAGIEVPFRPRRKQGEAMTIVYRKISGVDEHSLTGPTGLKNERWQLDVWGSEYLQVRQTANLVIDALNGEKGIVEEIDIRAIIQLDDSSDSERDADGGDRRQYNVSLDFQVVYRG